MIKNDDNINLLKEFEEIRLSQTIRIVVTMIDKESQTEDETLII